MISACPKCGLALYPITKPCHHCAKLNPDWDKLIAVANYVPPFTKLIYQFKFNHQTELAYPLARLMLLSWLKTRRKSGLLKPDILTCIPLHHTRYWSRGYNQSQLLAKWLAHWIGCEFSPYLLKRKSTRQDQKSLSQSQRKLNVNNVFHCNTPLAKKSIAIIDDIVTTGNTANEACKQLKSQGTNDIQIICLCRTSL